MKYVIIITDENEGTSDLIIDWLNYYNQPFHRISYSTPITIDKLLVDESGVKFNFTYLDFLGKTCEVDSERIKSIWYRRSKLNIPIKQPPSLSHQYFELINETITSIKEEHSTIKDFLNYLMKKRYKNINNYKDNFQNKLTNLEIANSIGIKIPDTLITSSSGELRSFFNKHNKKVITKPSSQGAPFGPNSKLNLYTTLITDRFIDSLPDKFALSTFQNNIEKQFELRVFYLEGVFFAMAIFSQNDNQTKVDFRNYNLETPNRTIPFLLPSEIEKKIIKLMKKLDLNCGSIDLIVDKNGNYVFLEVNPVGQFYQLTEPCNYHLDDVIANFLKNK